MGAIFTCIRGDTGEYPRFSCNACVSREQLGDYGYFSDSGRFCRQGNLFADIKSFVSEVDTVPRQQEVMVGQYSTIVDVDERALSLPSNHAFNSSLASLSPRLTNAYLVTRVVRCRQRESRAHTLCLVSDDWIRLEIGRQYHHDLVHNQKAIYLALRCGSLGISKAFS